jgi:hypothetical protein
MNLRFSRRLWFVFAPILLLGVTFGLRDVFWKDTEVDRTDTKADWKETEAKFRRDLRAWVKDVPLIQVVVQNSKPKPHFKGGVWEPSDFLSTVESIHLIRAQSKIPADEPVPSTHSKEPLIVVSLNDGGSVGDPTGFYISLKEDRGWIDLPGLLAEDNWTGVNWKNRGYELAPQTCRALKQHLFSLQDKNGELGLPK